MHRNTARSTRHPLGDTMRTSRSRSSNPFASSSPPPVQQELLRILQSQKAKRMQGATFVSTNSPVRNLQARPGTHRSMLADISDQNSNSFSPCKKSSNADSSSTKRKSTRNNKHDETDAFNRPSVLQDTLKQLKGKADERCAVNNHQHSKLQYICLSTACKCESRVGCAHCFIVSHQGHEKSRIDEFLKGYTGSYLSYLQNFDEFLKEMRMVKHRQEEILQQEMSVIRKVFLLQLDKFEKKLYREVRSKLASRLEKEYKTLEKAMQTISVIQGFQDLPSQSPIGAFNHKISSLLQVNLSKLNQMVAESLTTMRNRRDSPLLSTSEYQQKFIHVNRSVAQLFGSDVNESCTSRKQQAKQEQASNQPTILEQDVTPRDTMDYVEEISVSKLCSVRRYSPERPEEQQQQISFTQTIQNIPLFRKCPKINKNFLTRRLDFDCMPKGGMIEKLDFVNTLSVFSCCKNRYCCAACHDKYQKHESVEQLNNIKVTSRNCMTCGEVFEVPFGINVGINCKCISRKGQKPVMKATQQNLSPTNG